MVTRQDGTIPPPRGLAVPLVLALASMVFAPVAAAALADSGPATDNLDEIIVHGRWAALDELRNEMAQLEDRFFARYNALNPRKRFDVHCDVAARTGTRLERRSCRANFEKRGLQTEGVQHLQAMQNAFGDVALPQPFLSPEPAAIRINAQRKDFQRNMLKVVRENPELVDLLRQRAELFERYEALRGRGAESAED